MAILALNAVQDISRVPLAPAYQGSLTTTDTYTFPNDGKTFLHAKKSGAGACTLTVVTPGTVDGLAVADLAVTVPATTGDRMIGPFRPEMYNDPLTGLVTISFSEITGLTIAVIRLP